MDKRALITGGSGFIGTQLAAALNQNGWQITILSRNPQAARNRQQSDYLYAASFNELNEAEPFDLIINLAGASVGEGRWTPKRKQELLNSRINTTTALAAWLHQRNWKPKLVISGSAVGYYGNSDGGKADAANECSAPQERFVSELCQQWEAAATPIAEHSNIPLAIVRLGVVFGKNGGILPQILMPIKFNLVGKIGSGKQPLVWVHMADVIGVMLWLAEHPQPGKHVYNLVAPELSSQAEFVAAAAKSLHRSPFLSLPAAVMRMMMGEQADLVLGGRFVSSKALQEAGYTFQFPNLESALKNLLPL